MDHICWAPHMHKKFSGPYINAQLSNTFGHSLIVTLSPCPEISKQKSTFYKFQALILSLGEMGNLSLIYSWNYSNSTLQELGPVHIWQLLPMKQK